MSGDGSAFFDAIARRYDRVYALDRDASRRRMSRLLTELPERARVLDLGVGTGRELGALLDAGHAPVGLDASSAMLVICARRARPVPLVKASFWETWPFDDESFDAVIALHGTIAHPPDDDAMVALVREAARVLGEHGVFVAEVPSTEWLETLEERQEGDGEERSVRRVGADRCLYEDRALGVSIEARVFGEARWKGLFSAWPFVSVTPIEEGELFVVARRSTPRSQPSPSAP